MIDFGKGIVSGVIAAALLCGCLYLLSLAGALSRPDPVYVLSGITLFPPALSWIVQFALGAFVWGLLFAPASSILPGPYWLRGLIFGVLVWGVALGAAWLAPAAHLPIGATAVVLNLLFGAVLGTIYRALLD